MASLFSIQLGIYLLLFTTLACCVASPLTLEQRVQQLEKNKVLFLFCLYRMYIVIAYKSYRV